jgi:hypothetical protein
VDIKMAKNSEIKIKISLKLSWWFLLKMKFALKDEKEVRQVITENIVVRDYLK